MHNLRNIVFSSPAYGPLYGSTKQSNRVPQNIDNKALWNHVYVSVWLKNEVYNIGLSNILRLDRGS